MAKDDYFVIVYQILKYLYDSLKKGKAIEEEKLTSAYFGVVDSYFSYILSSMYHQGFISGLRPIDSKLGQTFINLDDTVITPKGIEYLFDNNLIAKAKRTLKDIKEMVPGF
ncbi:hypothetical protein HMPREF2626_01560 [Aerococcus sp. HMSC062A02]|uniref:YjcQ family protein n=1 Tax=Aerococcus sp. HMSC062A02 TaxID=1715105 RepID=UPI0008A1BAD1|nr:YjcQ family protein [Aerococcus sp. HMSC062A02]OFN02624.1 hypothetical protein HMPREF2626_01560 [Aerococcus sp. HMSC062A02]